MNQIIDTLIKLSDKALNNNDVPISAIIVKDNKIIAKSYNQKVKNNDPMAHAEILCIKKAARKLKTNNLNDCTLYCLLHPCKMCEEVIKEVRIKKVYYLLDNNKIVNDKIEYKKINIDDESVNKLSNKISSFFRDKR